MECSKVQDRLAGFLQDDLRLTERLIVEVHVARCPACRSALHQVQDVLDACSTALKHPNPVDDYTALRERLAAADLAMAVPLREEFRPGRLSAAVGIAAALLIVIGASSPILTSRLWLDPLEQAVDQAVIEDLSSMDRPSELDQGWRPAEELLGDEAAWDNLRFAPAIAAIDAP